jgi:hypothetical protein
MARKKRGKIAAAVGIAVGAGIAQSPFAKAKHSKLGKKAMVEAARRRIDETYPEGVGDTPTAEVARKIGMAKKWHSVHRALGRM